MGLNDPLPRGTNRKTRSKDGESREESQFHSVSCWETLAETTSRYVKKGDPLYVEGRLNYRTYTDSESLMRGVTEIVASDVQFLSKGPGATAETPTEDPEMNANMEVVDLDSIPF